MSEKIVDYEWIALDHLSNANIKNLASAIILSAIKDGDVEFFEDDFDEWKSMMIKKDREHPLYDCEYLQEFKYKEFYKDLLFQIVQMEVKKTDIPKSILDERNLYENNPMETICKTLKCDATTVKKNAKLHGWTIACNYIEPTIFEL